MRYGILIQSYRSLLTPLPRTVALEEQHLVVELLAVLDPSGSGRRPVHPEYLRASTGPYATEAVLGMQTMLLVLVYQLARYMLYAAYTAKEPVPSLP